MACFQANCPRCRKRVTVVTILDDEAIKGALANNGTIEVMHTNEKADGTAEDHRWELNAQEKDNLQQSSVAD